MSGESEEWEEDSEKISDDKDSLCMILAEEKMRHHDRELQTDPSSGIYNLEQQYAYGGEELEKIAVSRKPFRELSSSSSVSTNLEPDDDREVLRRIACVKLKEGIISPVRTEWSDDGIEGTRQSEIQTVGSDTSPEV